MIFPESVHTKPQEVNKMAQDPAFAELPLGFGMALSQHPTAMERFTSMTDEQKQQVITQTHRIQSKQEMQAFVRSLEAK